MLEVAVDMGERSTRGSAVAREDPVQDLPSTDSSAADIEKCPTNDWKGLD